MDGSGIDFVEASFGAEVAAAGGGKLQGRSAEDWDKWFNRQDSFLPKPLLIVLVFFAALIGLPFLLDFVQSNNNLSQKGESGSEAQFSQSASQDSSESSYQTAEQVYNQQSQVSGPLPFGQALQLPPVVGQPQYGQPQYGQQLQQYVPGAAYWTNSHLYAPPEDGRVKQRIVVNR